MSTLPPFFEATVGRLRKQLEAACERGFFVYDFKSGSGRQGRTNARIDIGPAYSAWTNYQSQRNNGNNEFVLVINRGRDTTLVSFAVYDVKKTHTLITMLQVAFPIREQRKKTYRFGERVPNNKAAETIETYLRRLGSPGIKAELLKLAVEPMGDA